MDQTPPSNEYGRHRVAAGLDVEGHEKHALKGACHLLHRCRPIPTLENQGNGTWIQRIFRTLGDARRGTLPGCFVQSTTELTV